MNTCTKKNKSKIKARLSHTSGNPDSVMTTYLPEPVCFISVYRLATVEQAEKGL